MAEIIRNSTFRGAEQQKVQRSLVQYQSEACYSNDTITAKYPQEMCVCV